NVHSLHAGELAKRGGAASSRAAQRSELGQEIQYQLLAVPHEDAIEEVGQRLGIEGHGASADDQRIALLAIGRKKRNPSQVEHRQNVGVVELVLQRETDDVEVSQGRFAFQSGERYTLPTQLLLHVQP